MSTSTVFEPLPQTTSRPAPHPARPGPTGAGPGMPEFLRQATPDAGVLDAPSAAGVAVAEPVDAGVAAGPIDAGSTLPGGVAAQPGAPVRPGTCLTPEEEERKARFGRSMFTALDFRPPSAGFGKFDAYYWPLISLMAAIVKMKFNYVMADNTPPLGTLFSMLTAGQDITRFFWTEEQKRQFAEEYVRRVAGRWSFAHTFRSTKPCWPFSARPYVTPRVVDDAADAHFEVTVHKSPGPGIDYSSGFRAQNPGTAGWRGTGDLYSSDVREEPNFNSVDVARSERQRLERAIAAATATPVQFGKGSAVLQAPYPERLRALAEAMKAKNPSDPAIPIVLAGFASSEGQRERNVRLSQERAEAVAEELRRAGVPQPLVVSPRGPVGAANDAANRKVEIAPSTSFETTYASNRYSVAEHEFGHALGLPDEYVNNTTGPLGAQQAAFVALAQAAHVAPPDRWGTRTASQMADGIDVLARHYLTLWEALGQMTSPDITRDEWSID